MRVLRVAPVLLVRDIAASVEFWRERVGFETDTLHGEPPSFAMPTRDGVTIMLAQAPPGSEPPVPNWRVLDKANQVYVWVDDANALYDELRGRGAPIDFSIYDTPWGTREFGIQDPEEHDIAFGQVLPG
ncbi:MAG TPA: VOC family protein [Gaiella sp.]|uniref:VOC family protein n=1 Tax=Gaiella sp. TaxID=2663207 RepID=UPI002D807A02|nr:VOC family protein [Gaiella sp.]HET9286103.1 VOC family protein [Gaiella sp.]